ncbi:thioredoxin domain [Arthrobacter phage Richie]|uniref:Glutaredoxin n=1 Tax=Arthrobacter phage Richie TaxID=2419967 RepID=A0A3G2KIT5_9CAUD|nr:thioredoxin domain [Arthrobacter phage Richie]AYN58902.1 glutaredoxin [Arthrobacter phage Richie]
MPAAARKSPLRAAASLTRKNDMTLEATQPTDLTNYIQARDGVAVVIYTKNDCRQCDMSKGLLDKAKIHYTAVNVQEDATAYHYVTEVLGIKQMPVLIASTIEGDEVWSGFQPAKIREHITHRADAA